MRPTVFTKFLNCLFKKLVWDKSLKSDSVKSLPTNLIAVSLFFLLILPFAVVPFGKADLGPSVRYVSIESKSGSELTVDWAIFKVDNWGDYVNLCFWVVRDNESYFVGSCDIKLCNTFYSQPDGQMTHPGYAEAGVNASSGAKSLIATAEMPFDVRQETQPIDGLQTYYFNKVHMAFNFSFQSNDTILVGGDYQSIPQYYSGDLPYYGPQNTGAFYEATYSSIPDGNNPFPSNPNVATSMPAATSATPTATPTIQPYTQNPIDSPQPIIPPNMSTPTLGIPTPTPNPTITSLNSEIQTDSQKSATNVVITNSMISITVALSGLCIGITFYKKHSARVP